MKEWCFLIDPGIRETSISNTLIPCSALLQLLQGQQPCTTDSEDLHAVSLIITNNFESLIELLSILAAASDTQVKIIISKKVMIRPWHLDICNLRYKILQKAVLHVRD